MKEGWWPFSTLKMKALHQIKKFFKNTICVWGCMHSGICRNAHLYACIWNPEEVFECPALSFCLRSLGQGLFLNLVLTARKLCNTCVSSTHSSEITGMPGHGWLSKNMGSRDLGSDPHSCTTNTFTNWTISLTELEKQLQSMCLSGKVLVSETCKESYNWL